MSTVPDWLPDTIRMEEFGGDWEGFLDAIYKVFQRDFIISKPIFRGRRLGHKGTPCQMVKKLHFGM